MGTPSNGCIGDEWRRFNSIGLSEVVLLQAICSHGETWIVGTDSVSVIMLLRVGRHGDKVRTRRCGGAEQGPFHYTFKQEFRSRTGFWHFWERSLELRFGVVKEYKG